MILLTAFPPSDSGYNNKKYWFLSILNIPLTIFRISLFLVVQESVKRSLCLSLYISTIPRSFIIPYMWKSHIFSTIHLLRSHSYIWLPIYLYYNCNFCSISKHCLLLFQLPNRNKCHHISLPIVKKLWNHPDSSFPNILSQIF